jgi:hypothetical protein
MALTVTYSHAAPYIRQALCHAAEHAENARTQRDRRAKIAEVRGLALALGIMAASDDQIPMPGIADVETLPRGSIAAARRFLSDRTADELGIVAPEGVRERPW